MTAPTLPTEFAEALTEWGFVIDSVVLTFGDLVPQLRADAEAARAAGNTEGAAAIDQNADELGGPDAPLIVNVHRPLPDGTRTGALAVEEVRLRVCPHVTVQMP